MIGYKHVGAALLVGCLAVGCDFSMQTNATKAQLPTLAGYRQHEGEQLTNQLGDNTILQTLLGGQPQLAFVADIITNVGTCAQENGAVNWRVC